MALILGILVPSVVNGYFPVLVPLIAAMLSWWVVVELLQRFGFKASFLAASLVTAVVFSGAFYLLRNAELRTVSTEYADGYSLEAFKSIKLDDSVEQVYRVLGPPLFVEYDPGLNVYFDRGLFTSDVDVSGISSEFEVSRATECDWRVINITNVLSFPGLASVDAVSVGSSGKIVLHYTSLRRGCDFHSVRAIVISERTHRVCGKLKTYE